MPVVPREQRKLYEFQIPAFSCVPILSVFFIACAVFVFTCNSTRLLHEIPAMAFILGYHPIGWFISSNRLD